MRGSRSVCSGPPFVESTALYWPEMKYHSLSLMNGPPNWSVLSLSRFVVGSRSGMFEFFEVSDWPLYSGQSLTSKNSNIPDLEPTTKRLNDSTLQFGGPFIKDKLWYFISGQYNAVDSTNGGPLQTERDPRIFTKVDWQVTQSSTAGGWLEYDRYDITGRGANASTPLEATVREKAPEVVWNFSEHTVLTPDTLFSL